MGDLICGVKLTHDGGIAVIEGDRLLFSVEAEKLDNRPRYSVLNKSADMAAILSGNGLSVDDLAGVAIDGWGRRPDGTSGARVVGDSGTEVPLEVASYADAPGACEELLDVPVHSGPVFGSLPTEFRSFTHATDHGLASYCTSPFAEQERRSLILVWDGGMMPCLYLFEPAKRRLESIGPVMPVSGGLYPIFAAHFDPFRIPSTGGDMDAWEMAILSVSGKAMAYAGLSEPDEDVIAVLHEVTSRILPVDGMIRSYMWSSRALKELSGRNHDDATVLASFQEHLGRMLERSLEKFLTARPDLAGLPICLSGGCALNIKWNARLRASGLFEDVWVPPFPNDAGSAIGAASAEMIRRTGRWALQWSVFAGPDIVPCATPPDGWTARPCSLEGVAGILATEQQPVVVIASRAELGPRALGHRSIIAPATSAAMRDWLNKIKGREWYRPVAPICLENRAPDIFSPGTRDPYMLFDHQVRASWRDLIGAVTHADGSARLQTVGPDNELMYRLLTAYEERTGVPVLCNTSANFKGSGFFPDAASAMRWGQVRYVWSQDVLFTGPGQKPSPLG